MSGRREGKQLAGESFGTLVFWFFGAVCLLVFRSSLSLCVSEQLVSLSFGAVGLLVFRSSWSRFLEQLVSFFGAVGLLVFRSSWSPCFSEQLVSFFGAVGLVFWSSWSPCLSEQLVSLFFGAVGLLVFRSDLCPFCLCSSSSVGPLAGRPRARLKASTPNEAPTPALTTKTLLPTTANQHSRRTEATRRALTFNTAVKREDCAVLVAPYQHREATSHLSR